MYHVDLDLSLRTGKKIGGAGNYIYLSLQFISDCVYVQPRRLTKNEVSYTDRYLLAVVFSQDAKMSWKSYGSTSVNEIIRHREGNSFFAGWEVVVKLKLL